MKIIELLNKIANDEEVPKKIKYENNIYILLDNYCYFCDKTNLILSDRIFAEHNRLNDEVEIIEEDKKIDYLTNEEITLYADEEPVETIVNFDNKELVNKINEIIDEVNKLKDDRK